MPGKLAYAMALGTALLVGAISAGCGSGEAGDKTAWFDYVSSVWAQIKGRVEGSDAVRTPKAAMDAETVAASEAPQGAAVTE